MTFKARKGSAAVELALALPVLMIFALGIVDVGRVLNTSAALKRGVSAGARRASDPAIADTAIISIVGAAANPVVPATSNIARAGDSVVVAASASVTSLTPLWHLIWATPTITVNASATARINGS
jgi:Flp pilus assembly protein TadG